LPNLPASITILFSVIPTKGRSMTTTITLKGQITIPKQIRDALGLVPGMQLDFAVNHEGEVVLQKKITKKRQKPDRFSAVRGKADIKWRTQDLMALLRNDI
jgi:AbrB family looped-hinge helix DNA binding protein